VPTPDARAGDLESTYVHYATAGGVEEARAAGRQGQARQLAVQ